MESMSNAPAPPISPERLKLIRQVSNRLFIALGVLLLIFIPAGFLVYWKLFAGAVPLMALSVGFFGGLARISHSAKKRTAFLSHKLLFNDNFSQSKRAVRCLQSVASKRSISSPWVRGK